MPELKLGFPFSDRMVLQRDQDNYVWGRDRPSARVTLTVEGGLSEIKAEAETDETGAFRLSLPPLAPGGPYRLVVEGSSAISIDDVMVGEVWLASGQSNMEWPVSASADADAVIEAADDRQLRVLKVQRKASWEPSDEGEGTWESAHPDAVASFTAVGYHFARELRQALGVPVGIIDATWGGTLISAWTSVAGQRAVHPEVDEELKSLRERLPERDRLEAEFKEMLSNWEGDSLPSDPPHTGIEKGYARPSFDDSAWSEIKVPSFWQDHGMKFNGVVWFRHRVRVPGEWAGRDLALNLGAIDDFDHTYFNGEEVGAHPAGTWEAFQIQRKYVIPGHLVKAGENVIAVRVFDHFGQGGFAGPARALSLCLAGEEVEPVSLVGNWRCFAEHPIPLVSAEIWSSYPRPPLLLTPEHMPGALFNGMIAPVVPYGLRGFLWYQGESDVDRHEQYAARQIALVRDFRTHFEKGTLPFLLVELAGFRGGREWPFLRESQQQATVEPGVALATARDIGDPDDIHPRNKKEVGRRLGLVARNLVYGEKVQSSGPIFEAARVSGGKMIVSFHSQGGLSVRDGAPLEGFELAGRDGVFHSADATIEGTTVVLTSGNVPEPVHVRYAFTDTGEGNLESQGGLPALSFRTDGFGVEGG